MAIIQYPHYLFVENASDSYQDEHGNWVESVQSQQFISMCREESGGKSSEYQVAGGNYIKATSTIQLPKNCPNVESGQRIIVANDIECTDIRISGICLNFDRTQLHSRLWV